MGHRKADEWAVQVLGLAGASGCVETVRSISRLVINSARQFSVVIRKAIYFNHLDLIRRLCHKKASSDSDAGLDDFLYLAVCTRHFKAVELLLELGAEDGKAGALWQAIH
jgi:hypothetical protein